MALASLRLQEYPDAELLAIVNDMADGDGWSTSEAIAAQIGIDAKHARQCVGSRLSWLRRWGYVERHPEIPAWQVSPLGNALLGGKLTKTARGIIERMNDADRVLFTRLLASTSRAAGASSKAYEREWKREMYLTP